MKKLLIGIGIVWVIASAGVIDIKPVTAGGNLMNQNQASQLDAAER